MNKSFDVDEVIEQALSRQEEVPENFAEKLHLHLHEQERKSETIRLAYEKSKLGGTVRVSETKKRSIKKNGMKYLSVAAAIIIVFLVALPFMDTLGMKNASNKSFPQEAEIYDGKHDAIRGTGEESNNPFGSGSQKDQVQSRGDETASKDMVSETTSKKIIENFYIGMETKTFDDAKILIESTAQESGGFVASFEVFGSGSGNDRRTATMVIKIPQVGSGDYLTVLHTAGKIYRESKMMDDVTKVYSDISIELRNYEEAEKRYLELYQKAETIEDMLLVENELNRLRNLIDTRKATLKNYDYQASYSTFHVELMEIIEEKQVVDVEPGTWEKAKNGFIGKINSLIKWAQNTFVAIITAVPVLMTGLVLFLLGWLLYRIGRKVIFRKKQKRKVQDLSKEMGDFKEENTEP